MTQAQIQIPETMKKAIENIKEFFESRNLKFKLDIYEINTMLDISKPIRADFNFDKPNKLSNEEFNKLINSLKELGFQHVNEGKNIVMKLVTDNCKLYDIYDAYKHLQENDLMLFIKYIKDESDNKTIIKLNEILVEKNEIYIRMYA